MTRRPAPPAWAWTALWLCLVALYVVPPIAHLGDDAWDYDEGPTLQAAALSAVGHGLYTAVPLNKPPLLVWALRAAFSVGGVTVASGRVLVLALTALGFVALGLLAARWWGRAAGPATLAVLLCIPEVPLRAAVVMADLPALSAGAAALLAATRYRQTGQRRHAAAGAVACAAVLGLHPLLGYILVPAGFLALGPGGTARSRARATALGAGVLAAQAAALGCVYPPRAMARWIGRYNLTLGAGGRHLAEGNWWSLRVYLTAHAALALAAGASVALVWARGRRAAVTAAGLWFCATVAVLGLWRPLWDNYLLLLLVPLAVLTGGGLTEAVRLAADRARGNAGVERWRLVVAAVAVAGALVTAHQRFRAPLAWPVWTAQRAAARDYLRAHTGPGEAVAADDQFLVFAAGRRVPPALADTSHKSLATGWLRGPEVVGAITGARVRYVALASGRFALRLPEVVAWLEATAVERRDFGDVRVYRLPEVAGR